MTSRPCGALLLAALSLVLTACGHDATGGLAPTAPHGAAAPAETLLPVSGDGQSGFVGQPLAQPLVVRVTKAGKPVPGAVVNWLANDGGSADPRQSSTDDSGYARTVWTLGPGTGAQTLRASGVGGTFLFRATGLPVPVPVRLVKVSGDAQSGPASSPLPAPLVVRAVTSTGAGVGGVRVTWTVASGGGRVSMAVGFTAADGTTSTQWTLGASGAQSVTATAPSLAGAAFSATIATPPPPTPGGAPVAMYVLPNPMWLAVGDTAHLRVVFLDAQGNVTRGPAPTFASMSGDVTVDATGLVRVRALSAAAIDVRAAPFRTLATVNPWKPQERYGAPQRALYVVPELSHVPQGQSLQLRALWVEPTGVTAVRDVAWRATSGYASVSATGLAQGVEQGGGTRIYAERAGRRGVADVYVDAPPLDTYPPLLEGLVITPATPSVRDAPAAVSFRVSAHDQGSSGYDRMAVHVTGPDNRAYDCAAQGTTCSISIPKGAAAGRYAVSWVRVTDVAGNANTVYPGSLAAIGSPTYFTVSN